jgi:hypothetical protein
MSRCPDTVKVEADLPGDPRLKKHVFETRSLEQDLSIFTIRSDGTIVVERQDWKGYAQTLPPEPIGDVTTMIRFGKDVLVAEGEQWTVEFEAVIVEGKLYRPIRLVKWEPSDPHLPSKEPI